MVSKTVCWKVIRLVCISVQLNRPVEKVIVTLDVNEEVVDEAIEKGANLIIAHHPPIFRPIKNIATDTPQGRSLRNVLNMIFPFMLHIRIWMSLLVE